MKRSNQEYFLSCLILIYIRPYTNTSPLPFQSGMDRFLSRAYHRETRSVQMGLECCEKKLINKSSYLSLEFKNKFCLKQFLSNTHVGMCLLFMVINAVVIQEAVKKIIPIAAPTDAKLTRCKKRIKFWFKLNLFS